MFIRITTIKETISLPENTFIERATILFLPLQGNTTKNFAQKKFILKEGQKAISSNLATITIERSVRLCVYLSVCPSMHMAVNLFCSFFFLRKTLTRRKSWKIETGLNRREKSSVWKTRQENSINTIYDNYWFFLGLNVRFVSMHDKKTPIDDMELKAAIQISAFPRGQNRCGFLQHWGKTVVVIVDNLSISLVSSNMSREHFLAKFYLEKLMQISRTIMSALLQIKKYIGLS